MKTIIDKKLNETLYYEEMDNGLKVYLLNKNGFSKTYGLFSTNFGSIDTTFIPIDESEMIKVPDGVAHFLEHKMFELEDGDVSDLFASYGASTNAFTSTTRTAYLFSTTSHESECIELLLDFVQNLTLSDESVEKEKGIINQEIGMYDDDPDWRCYFGSIQNLYQKHPIRIDIAGTVETVETINKDFLEKCYHSFYHPSNMMLFVVGNIEIEKTIDLIRNNQNKKTFIKKSAIQREEIIEPRELDKKYDVLYMDVTIPKIIISIKINDILDDPKRKLKRELSMNILLDLLFSKSSSLYEQWSKEGIINDSFSAIFTQEKSYSFLQIGGDSQKVDCLKEKIYQLIESMKDYKIDEKAFNRVKRKTIGMFISVFNSPESIANLFSRYYFENIMLFDIIPTLEEITLEDLYELIPLFNIEYTSYYMVLPQ